MSLRKKGHENGTSIGYSIGECKDYEPSEDCISRQAVIDKAFDFMDDDCETYRAVYVSDIRNMPSVTPKASEEDIHREREQAYMLGYEDASKRFRTEPSEDCISREHAKQFLYYEIEQLHDDGLYDCFSRIIDDMYNELPSVTPQPKKGKWIETPVENDIVTVVFKCSECGKRVVNPYDYCPNCGSYNGGGEDET